MNAALVEARQKAGWWDEPSIECATEIAAALRDKADPGLPAGIALVQESVMDMNQTFWQGLSSSPALSAMETIVDACRLSSELSPLTCEKPASAKRRI